VKDVWWAIWEGKGEWWLEAGSWWEMVRWRLEVKVEDGE